MTLKRSQCLILLGLVLAFLVPQRATSAFDDGAGREAVRRGTNPIWVDRSTDEVKAPEQQMERSDVSDRHASIREKSGRPFWDRLFGTSWGSSGNTNWGIADFMTWAFGAWRIVVAIMLAILLGILLFILIRSRVLQSFFRRRKSLEVDEDLEQQRAKISDLPFEIEQPLLGLRAQAEKYRGAGDYSKALIYLFSYLLVEMDRSQCIRLERGKTNGAYLRELRPWPQLARLMQSTVGLFERVYFGRKSIDRESFESLWSQLGPLEAAMAQVRSSKQRDEPESIMPMLSNSGV